MSDLFLQPMEDIKPNTNLLFTPITCNIANFVTNNPIVIKPNTTSTQKNEEWGWNDVEATEYLCRYCNKSFFNCAALKNHLRFFHDGEATDDEGDTLALSATYNFINQAFADVDMGVTNFSFIPLLEAEEDLTFVQEGGLTSRTFSRDTTYVVVKLAPEEADAKRSRLESVVKRAHAKPKPKPATVNLRGPFTCTFPSSLQPGAQCRQIFYNCCEYSLHYREEHTKRRKAALRCQVCEKRLDRDDLYTYPSHPPSYPAPTRHTFSCRLCSQTFFTSAQYDEHNRIMHVKLKPFQCSICAKRFTQQGGLQQHIRMHTGIRPFACTYCPKAFTQKAGLDQHLRTHTKVKPFKCVICGKGFSQSVHLRQHMRTHTNIQPFQCTLCKRRFKQTSHLNFHMRSHGEAAQGLAVDSCAQEVPGHGTSIDFLELTNVQPVVDGDTLYYAAELSLSAPNAPACPYPTAPPVNINMADLTLTL